MAQSSKNWHLAFLGRVLLDGDYRLVQKAGLTLDMFPPESQVVLQEIADYYGEYGSTPAPDYLVGVHPALKPYIDPEFNDSPTAALAARVRKIWLHAELDEGVNSILEDNGTNPQKTLQELYGLCLRLQPAAAGAADSVVGANISEIWAAYERSKMGKGHGVEYPWQTIQEASGGIMPTDFILYYGRPKIGKTWIVIAHACQAWLRKKENVVVISQEMSYEELSLRCAAFMASIDTGRLRRGELTETEEGKFRKALKELNDKEKKGQIIIVTVQPSKRADTPALADIIWDKYRAYNPCLILVDTLYLFWDRDKTKDRITRFPILTGEMKQVARRMNCPVVATSSSSRLNQVKGRASLVTDGSDVSFGDGGAQDTDAYIRVADNKNLGVLGFVPTARDWRCPPFIINYKPAIDLEETHEYGIGDVFHDNEKEKKGGKPKDRERVGRERAMRAFAQLENRVVGDSDS